MQLTLFNFVNSLNIGKKSGLKEIHINGKPSNMIKNIISLIFKEGFIRGYSYTEKGVYIYYRFDNAGKNVISHVQLLSTGSQVLFSGINTLWKKEKGNGLFILTTSMGVLTDTDARLLNVGGKLLLSIY